MEDKDNKLIVEEHNASFDEDPILEDISEDELQDAILEDSGMNGSQRFVAKMDDKKWTLAQRVLGIVLGIAASLALFGESLFKKNAEEAMGTYSLVLAVVIAMLIPNIIEKQAGRKIYIARTTMAITLAVTLVIYFVYAGINGGFSFFTK